MRFARAALLLLFAWTVAPPSECRAGLADIIIVLDSSGDMPEELADFQANIQLMADGMDSAGVDAHFVLIGDGVCIAAPLGSGSCPSDELLPGFRHIDLSVGSNSALQDLLDTHPQWQDSLRPGATRVILVVSSDNSGMSAANFGTALLALDPSFAGYQFHAYVAQGSCGAGAAIGTVYLQLVAGTGGVSGDLCDQDIEPFILVSTAATVASASIFRRGDANRDGAFDIADPILVLGFLFGSAPLDCPSAADANDDEAVDIADAISSLAALFGGGPPPPPPFLGCGPDPTPGTLGCGGASGCL
jgi:hypothetical protein